MSAVTGLGRRMAAAFEEALHSHLTTHRPPARSVPAAADWDDWHYADERSPWEDER